MAIGVLVTVYVLDIARGLARRYIAEQLIGKEAANRSVLIWLVECLGTPLWMAVHFSLYVGTLFGRRFRWAGVHYRIDGPNDVIVTHRA